MNKKELNEIRRRIKPDGNSISKIYTCFINSERNIISKGEVSTGIMSTEEVETYMKLLKKVLTGSQGKNLIDIEFATAQVANSDEHRRLMKLRDSKLEDEASREEFLRLAIAGLKKDDSSYLLLLAYDVYDVPYKATDGTKMYDAGAEIFPYVLFCACPVKEASLELRYELDTREFHTALSSQTVSNPELGFMFPCFDDRRSNIYNALYYVKNQAEIHPEFIDGIFNVSAPMTAPEQKEAFGEAISSTLAEECSIGVMANVQSQLLSRIELHKEEKIPEKLTVSIPEVGAILRDSGVSEEKIEAFSGNLSEQLRDTTVIEPELVIECKKFEVQTPEIKISVAPENAWMIETRELEGKKYILIPADAGAEVNGISVEI